jgi:hypothetical protein
VLAGRGDVRCRSGDRHQHGGEVLQLTEDRVAEHGPDRPIDHAVVERQRQVHQVRRRYLLRWGRLSIRHPRPKEEEQVFD